MYNVLAAFFGITRIRLQSATKVSEDAANGSTAAGVEVIK